MTLRLFVRRLDYLLVLAVAGVCVYSHQTIGSVTRTDIPGNPTYYLHRHAAYLAIGTLLGIITSLIDPKYYRRWQSVAYGAILLLLVVVLFVAAARGSSRWITLPGFTFQPSEIGKLVVIVVLAGFVAARSRLAPGSWRTFCETLGLATIPAGLVFLEPDLGTSVIYLVAALTILFVAGARWTQLALVVAVFIVAVVMVFRVLPASGLHVLAPYQAQRLTAFLNPGSPSVAAYQSHQSLNAIGSGGITGRGVAGANIVRLNYLPEHHTDFVFASVGEQRGFVGTGMLLALFGVIIWRAIRSATLAATLYESLIAAGVAGMLLTQIFVNVGMTLGIMPTTGIPLPFLTYGGSNTITNMISVGLLVAVQVRGGVPERPALADHDLVQQPRSTRRRRRVEPVS